MLESTDRVCCESAACGQLLLGESPNLAQALDVSPEQVPLEIVAHV